MEQSLPVLPVLPVLTDEYPYGHQVTLVCVNHPELEWQAKNIAPLGCRTIFFDLFNKSRRGECRCPLSDLKLKNEYLYGTE